MIGGPPAEEYTLHTGRYGEGRGIVVRRFDGAWRSHVVLVFTYSRYGSLRPTAVEMGRWKVWRSQGPAEYQRVIDVVRLVFRADAVID